MSAPDRASPGDRAAGRATIRHPPKRLEVDIAALRSNAAAIVAHVGPGTAVMAMVKANGYGHGTMHAARAALAGGATWLGVVSGEEALEVSDLDARVLIVGPADPELHGPLVDAGVELTVFTPDAVAAVAGAARAHGRRARVHVKIDTGMGRLGARPEELGAVLEALERHRDAVDISGVFTHFADSERVDDGLLHAQHDRFLPLAAQVTALAPKAVVHCSNSGAILRAPALHHDLVRLGIALYGYPPPVVADVVALRPALTMIAPVTHVKTVLPGESVGYGHTWTATATTRVASVGAGYADGVFRAASNVGRVLVHGVRCPIVGRVSMDQITVDVSAPDAAATVRPGDDAVLFGRQDGARLGADEIAALIDTIPHEVLCAVPDRVPRVATDD